jgi:hypothetical protein
VERLDYRAITSGKKRQSIQEIALSAATSEESRNFNEAMESDLNLELSEAINRELASIYSHDTWGVAATVPEGVIPLT